MNQQTAAKGMFAVGFYGSIGWVLAYGLTTFFGLPWLIGPTIMFLAIAFIGMAFLEEQESKALGAEDL